MRQLLCAFYVASLFVCLSTATADENSVVLETNFQTCDYGKPLTIPTKSTQGVIQGRFPQGWKDNSIWAPVVYTSQRMVEGTDAFWRLAIAMPLKTQIQLMHNLPDMGGDDYFYELSMMARGDQSLEIGVRQHNDPYQFIWRVHKNTGTEWQTYRWQFKVRKTTAAECGLWLNIIGSPAVMDFKNIKLRELTSKQMQQEAMQKFQGQGPANLLRQSRFPLGLQSGWALDKNLDDADDVQIESVSDASSPTGHAVLQIVSKDKSMLLRGEPVRIDRTWLKQTASVYVSGQGRFELAVNNKQKTLGHKAIELTSSMGWQRLEVTFKPIISHDSTFLSFRGQGDFKIDGLMLHSGDHAKKYQSQKPVEVALAAGEGEVASFSRVHFENEKPQFRYAITGLPKNNNARLRINFANAYGKKQQRIIDLTTINMINGVVNYDVFADQPFGSTRIEAIVEDEQGHALSSANEWVMHRLRRPRYWMKDAPNSAFGVHTLSTRRHIQMAKALGINWTRLHDAGTEYMGWYHLEPKPGQWEFRDTELHRYRQYGLKIFGALSTAPKWASMYPGFDVKKYFDRFYMPKDFQQFANDYVKVVVKRYADVIDAWDVWNEPWGTWWASGYDKTKKGRAGYIQGPNEIQSFAEFQKVVYQAVKSVKPDALVAGFNTHVSSFGSSVQWTKGILKNGGTPYADFFSYHQYTHSNTGYPNDVVQLGLADQAKVFPSNKLPYAAWMTEGSPTSGQLGDGLYKVTVPRPNDEDVMLTSDRLGRFCLSLLTSKVQRFFLYSMHCHNYFGMANGHQVLMTEEGYLHPSADALSALTYFLEDKKFEKHTTLALGVNEYLFKGKHGKVSVLSTTPGKREVYKMPINHVKKYFDLFGNPLQAGTTLGDTLVFVVHP